MATKKKTKKKLSDKQIKYFGTPAQKAALKRKRSTASKKTTKKTTKKKTTKKSNKTLTTGQGVAIGLGSAAVGAAGGALAATALQNQIQDLLNRLAQANIPIVSTVAGALGNKQTGNTTPIPGASTQGLPVGTVPTTPQTPIVTADPRYAPLNPGTPGTLGTGSLAQGGDGFDPNTGEYIG